MDLPTPCARARGSTGGTGSRLAEHPGAMQYCDSVTRGPHVPPPERAGEKDRALGWPRPPGMPHAWLSHARNLHSRRRWHWASPCPSPPAPSP